jgi:hypothetical protein
MPTTTVTSPDGKQIKVRHPEGASREEIIAYAKQNAGPAMSMEPQAQPGRVGTIADSALKGLGLGFGDEVAGALGAIPAAISTGNSIGDSYRGIRDIAREREAGYARENPGTAIAAEIGGGLLTGGAGGARALAGTAGRQMLARAGAVGAGYGGASGLGLSEADTAGGLAVDTGIGAVIGGTAGAAFPAVGNRLAKTRAAQAIKSSSPYQAAVRVLDKAKVALTSGQREGANWIKAFEETLADVPIGGKPLQRVFENQNAKVQFRLWELSGLPKAKIADDGLLTKKNIDSAREVFSRRYRDAIGDRKINLADDAFLNDLGEIEAKYLQSGDVTAEGMITRLVNKLLDDAQGGPKTGDWYQARRSFYGAFEKANKSDVRGQVYGDLKGALDAAFARAAGGDTTRQINREYANFMRLKSLYDRMAGGAQGAEGLVPLSQLAREGRKGKSTQEFQELAEAATQVITPRLGNSGTAQRSAMLGLLGGGQGAAAILDPMSLIYGPAMARGVSEMTSRGVPLNVAKMLPSGQSLLNPRLPGAAAASANILAAPMRDGQ